MSARELPPDVAAALDSVPEARERFASLPPERQAEWLAWIDRARGGRGRAARLDEAVSRLAGATPVAAGATEEIVEAPPPPPPVERHWWAWLLLLLLVVIGGLLAWFLLSRGGGEKRTVPEVVGIPQPVAELRIHNEELDALAEHRPSLEAFGTVIAQRPSSGTQIDKGGTVTIAVSSGPPRGSVPDVTGSALEPAKAKVSSLGFKPVIRRVFSSRSPGLVVGQDPAPGVIARKGAVVTLSVSKGQELVTVPRLTALQENDALRQVTAAGLVASVKRVSSSKPAGTVIGQKPPAGKKVPKGTPVTLTIAARPGGTTTVSTTTTTAAAGGSTATVPRLLGGGLTSSIRRLQAVGLRPRVVYVASSRRPRIVLSQRPIAGTRLPKGSRVLLNVSSGPNPQAPQTVPDVLGQDAAAAASTLRQAGFQVVSLRQPTTDPSQEGLVVDEQPAAGSRIPGGLQVTIFVGST